MPYNTLLLPLHHTTESQMIWREAVRRGWKIVRCKDGAGINDLLSDAAMVRYYGDVLNGSMVTTNVLKFRFTPIPGNFLSNLDRVYTNRKIELMEYRDLVQPLERDLFIKTLGIKWMTAQVYKAGTTIESNMLPHDLIYVQDVHPFESEIRCFVLGGRVVTASWYRQARSFLPENIAIEDIPVPCQLAEEICQQSNLPEGIVLDFGIDSHGWWSLIEANEAWASGLYDCDPSKAFDVIVASQTSVDLFSK